MWDVLLGFGLVESTAEAFGHVRWRMWNVLLGFGLVESTAEALGHRPAIDVGGPARLRLCGIDFGGLRAPRPSFNVEGSFGFGRVGRPLRELDTAPENVISVRGSFAAFCERLGTCFFRGDTGETSACRTRVARGLRFASRSGEPFRACPVCP